MSKETSFWVLLFAGAALTLGASYWIYGEFVVPLASLSLGIFLIGLVLPDLLGEYKHSHTLWLPVAVTLLGMFALFFFYSENFSLVLSSTDWCGRTPCYPYGLFFLFFFVGNVLNWASHFMAGEKLDLIEGK
jgi:hypothetical protein